MMVARLSGPRPARRCSSTVVGTPRPSAASSSSPPASICTTRRTRGSRSATSSYSARWAAVSSTTTTAPESPTFHCTCSADDVSYTGTVTAPVDQIA